MNKAALLLLVCLGPLAFLACSAPDAPPASPPRAGVEAKLELLERIEAALPAPVQSERELEIYDASRSTGAMLKAAQEAMGVAPTGTLPQQAAALASMIWG